MSYGIYISLLNFSRKLHWGLHLASSSLRTHAFWSLFSYNWKLIKFLRDKNFEKLYNLETCSLIFTCHQNTTQHVERGQEITLYKLQPLIPTILGFWGNRQAKARGASLPYQRCCGLSSPHPSDVLGDNDSVGSS